MSQQDQPNSLKNQFLKAEAAVNEGRVQVPESLKYKLYGMGKQIVVGDCKMPQPPASNEILRAKWDAWMSYAGTPVETAMKEYIGIVEGLEPGVKAPLEKRVSAKLATGDQPGAIKRKGKLYKQRDFVKGWRARHFVLQDCYLHYYLDADEPVPRNTLDLTGCNVTSGKSLTVDGVEYFPFTISHPRSKLTYNLSSDSKLDADIWVAKILEAATANNFTNASTVSESPASREIVSEPITATGSYAVTKITDHSHETRAFVPAEIAAKLERLAQTAMDNLADSAAGWEPLTEKGGMIAKKKNSPGNIHIKAEVDLPYCLFDVFSLITDLSRQIELDPARASHERLKDISMHSWVDYIHAKGIWPTSPRDFVNFVNWRLLNTGQVLLLSFSDAMFQDLRAPRDGLVRGEMLLAAFLLTPTASGTRLQYLLHLDLKGSIPASVVAMAASSQAMLLLQIKKVMDSDKKKGMNTRAVNSSTDYSELVSMMADDTREAAAVSSKASPSTSPTPAAQTVPAHRRAALVKLANRSMKIGKMSMLVLLLPTLLYFVVEPGLRAAAFLAGIMISYHYLLRRHLGLPMTKVSKHFSLQMPTGKLVMRFPVDLGRLLVYLGEKRAESELEITFTHVVVKAVGLVLQEMPSLNGHVIASTFFPAKSLGVDLSVSLDISAKETVAMKLCDVDAKPLECVAEEILAAGKTLRSGGQLPNQPAAFFDKLDATLPSFLSILVKRLLYNLGSKIGISVPALGITPYPLGVCTVTNSPNMEKEEDMDLAILSDMGDAFAPITVTMSGMRVQPSLDADKRISGSPVLNFCVAMSTYAASMTEVRQFCARLQDLLNDPHKIDKLHAKADFARQEAAKRKIMFGKKDA